MFCIYFIKVFSVWGFEHCFKNKLVFIIQLWLKVFLYKENNYDTIILCTLRSWFELNIILWYSVPEKCGQSTFAKFDENVLQMSNCTSFRIVYIFDLKKIRFGKIFNAWYFLSFKSLRSILKRFRWNYMLPFTQNIMSYIVSNWTIQLSTKHNYKIIIL